MLQTLLNDIENDKDYKVNTKGDTTIITAKTNYTNNPELIQQKIYLNKNNDVIEVRVLDKENNIKMKMTYDKIDYKANLKKDDFSVESNMDISTIQTTMNSIKDIVYPMNLPENTYLKSEDKVSLENGERIILTFAGTNPFTLVEETARTSKTLETTVMDGEPEILLGTVGSVSDKEIKWINNGVEYYAMSNTLSSSELLEIVKSVSNNAIEK